MDGVWVAADQVDVCKRVGGDHDTLVGGPQRAIGRDKGYALRAGWQPEEFETAVVAGEGRLASGGDEHAHDALAAVGVPHAALDGAGLAAIRRIRPAGN